VTGRSPKPAAVRFYFDADVLGLARVIDRLRPDITFPADPGGIVHKRLRAPCPITTTATPDAEWIPEVAARRWVIITRDSRIQDHRAEIEAVRTHRARMVALSGRDAISCWDQLEILMCQWRRIEALVGGLAPAVYRATRSSLTPVPLD
jgi:PIN like domain